MDAIISHEERRGCGYRKPSAGGVGIYLMGPELNAPCGRMPFELKSCPTCGGGIKPSRGWNWITPRELFEAPLAEKNGGCPRYADAGPLLCKHCPMGLAVPEGRHGLIWVGEAHYPTPEDFLHEAKRLGLSRKIGAVPKGFELGTTVVYLAHRKAVRVYPQFGEDNFGETTTIEPTFHPGIFATFKPTGVDLVIADENSVPEKASKLAEKLGDGARIVKVIPKEGEQKSLPIVNDAHANP